MGGGRQVANNVEREGRVAIENTTMNSEPG